LEGGPRGFLHYETVFCGFCGAMLFARKMFSEIVLIKVSIQKHRIVFPGQSLSQNGKCNKDKRIAA
jgi:hypothetical protein